MNRGRLIVLEGPDGVGKSTLSGEIVRQLDEWGTRSVLATFPGRRRGTLGALVREIHHAPDALGLHRVTPVALQTLHLAAHLQTIEEEIVPAFAAGANVVLDRCWWSTWVYGRVAGIPARHLWALLALERRFWRALPRPLFLLVRPGASLGEQAAKVRAGNLWVEYVRLASRERRRSDVRLITNSGPPREVVQKLLLRTIQRS
jgi:dTMP kinase